MRKFILGLAATVMFGVFSFGQDITNLAKDKDFINYVNNEINFIEKGTDIVLLNEIWNDKKLDENELPKFYKLFSTNEIQYNNFIKSQNILLNSFISRYKLEKLSNDELIKVFTPYIKELKYSNNSDNTFSRNCRGVYLAQLTLNASVAVGAHFACGALDVTVVAGALCHGAVYAGQIAANYIALEDYRDCSGKK